MQFSPGGQDGQTGAGSQKGSLNSREIITKTRGTELALNYIRRLVGMFFLSTGENIAFEILMQCGGWVCPWLASVTFGGSDLRKLFLGGLRATSIPWVQSPVAGLPMAHW